MSLHQAEVRVRATKEKIYVEGRGDKLLAALGTVFVFLDNVPEDEMFSMIGKELFMFPDSSFYLKIFEDKIESNINVRREDAKQIIAAVINNIKGNPDDFLEVYYGVKDIMMSKFNDEFKDIGKRLQLLQRIVTEATKNE